MTRTRQYLEGPKELCAAGEAIPTYIYKDLRDVIVSTMIKEGSSFQHLVQRGFLRTLLEEYRAWTSIENTLISRYESTVHNLDEETRRLADHLGLDISDDIVDQNCTKYSLDQQRERIGSYDYDRAGEKVQHSVFDPHSLLHPNHIPSGKSGQWQQSLTRMQIGLIENDAYRWLTDLGYSVSTTWLVRKLSLFYKFYILHLRELVTSNAILIPLRKLFRFAGYAVNGQLKGKLSAKIRVYQQQRRNRRWKRHQEDSKPFAYPLQRNLTIMLFPDDKLSELVYKRDFESHERTVIRLYLQPGEIFVDIGANIGLHTLIGASAVGKSGKVYAFEPCSLSYGRLVENVNLNRLKNVLSSHLALSDEPGFYSLNVLSEGHLAWNSFAPPRVSVDFYEERVQCITWDYFALKNDLVGRVALIKIDVEGWELRVLRGAQNMLSRIDAPDLLVEFTDANAEAAGSSCAELFHYLQHLGYSMYAFDTNKGFLCKKAASEKYPYQNLLATKRITGLVKRLGYSVVDPAGSPLDIDKC